VTDPLLAQNQSLLRRFEGVQHFIPYLQQTTVMERWYRDLLACILIRCRTHFTHLSIAFQQPYQLEYIAWASRNLLELAIWAKYAITTKENAKRLNSDQANDLEDLLKGVVALAQKYTPQHQELDALKEQSAWIKDLKDEYGMDENDKRLNVGKVAVELGMGGLFYNLNPLLSKLVHPTAFSINLDLDGPREEQLRRMFLQIGQGATEDALRELTSYFDAVGIQTHHLRA
jgi:hypothetical protein